MDSLNRCWTNLPLRVKGIAVVTIPLLALLLPLLFLYRNAERSRAAQSLVERTLQIEGHLQALSSDLATAESAVRAYRLTQENRHLSFYRKERAEIRSKLVMLQKLIADPAQKQRLKQVEALSVRRLEAMETLQALPFEDGRASPELSRILGQGADVMKDLRLEIAEMLKAESQLFSRRRAESQAVSARTDNLILSALALGLLSTVVSAFLFTSGIVRRMHILEVNAHHLANAQEFHPFPSSSDEIGRLQDAMQATSILLAQRTQALESSRQRLQSFFERSIDVICTFDEKGCFTAVSPACETIWDYTSEELVGREFREFVHPEDKALTEQAWSDIISGQPAANFQNRYIRKDGTAVSITWSAVWSQADKTMFCVARDNSERQKAEAAIQQAMRDAETARQEAETANNAKSEFLSRMSHELRTPLNAILGFGQLLEMDDLNPEQQESVEQILKGGHHLLSLINEVLDIARIEAGRMELSIEPVDIGEVARDSIKLIQPLCLQDGITLRLTNAADPKLCVLADQQRIKQVLLNLLSNAVKYNRPNGVVHLYFEVQREVQKGEGVLALPLEAQSLRIFVEDTGPGIEAEKMEQLFVAFERLQSADRAIEGTGLGLALSKRLVELMDGTIGVESVPGKGSSFWIELPLADAMDESEGCDGATAEPSTSACEPVATRRVLYIEDNLPNLRLVERILSRHPGVELMSAMNGTLGLDLARQHYPDLVLLDLHLPGLSGDDILRSLQGDAATADIPIVVISADATPGHIERVLAGGARHYLTKPLDVRQFVAVLDDVLASSERAVDEAVEATKYS